MLSRSVSLAAKPAPLLWTELSDAAALNRRSFAFVVAIEPLLSVEPEPAAACVPSSGWAVSRPAYSWMYRRPNVLTAVENVAVMVSAPPAMPDAYRTEERRVGKECRS